MRPRVRLLTGRVTGVERRQVYDDIASGAADVIVGTHALIQKGVEFKDLALSIVDEQHRFGV
jgi:ATP-dependent DNA helicase RecG